MLSPILEDFEKLTPNSGLTHEQLKQLWPAIQKEFPSKVIELGETIVSSALPFLSKSIAGNSKFECTVCKDPAISIAEYRVRPSSNYYNSLNIPIPAPENPKGPHATGCEFSVSLLSSLISSKNIIPTRVVCEFQVWGSNEREAFGEMYKDYKRPLNNLIQTHEFDFHTSVPFDNVDKYKGKNVAKKLELYYENTVDDENFFSLSKDFILGDSLSDAIKASFPLLTLYDCLLNYSSVRKNKNKVWEILRHLKEI